MWLYMVTPDRPPHAIERMAERVLEAAAKLNDVYLESLTYLLLSFDFLQRGHLTAAREWAEKLIDLGKRTGYPPAQSLGWVCAAWAAAFAEDHEQALTIASLPSAPATGSSSASWPTPRRGWCWPARDARRAETGWRASGPKSSAAAISCS